MCLCCNSVGSVLEALGQVLVSHSLGIVMLASDSSIWKLEAQGLGVRDHPQLCCKF